MFAAGRLRFQPSRFRVPWFTHSGGQNHPIARRLAEIHEVGPQTAGILATEVFYRGFRKSPGSRELCRLDADTLQQRHDVRDQGISKAGHRRARAVAVELAWIWLRNQPESKLSRWFRTGSIRGHSHHVRESREAIRRPVWGPRLAMRRWCGRRPPRRIVYPPS